MKAILLALSLAQPLPLSPAPPELSQLKWLIGDWSCRIQFHDPERSIVSRWTYALDLDGYCLTLTTQQLGGAPGRAIAHIVWDASAKTFVQLRVDKRSWMVLTRRSLDADHWDWIGTRTSQEGQRPVLIHDTRKSDREFTFRNERDGRNTEEATCTRL
ncbi:MAG: hypothetical protein E6J78_14125 [Deltaproteobacteria bacterium]|nr:MAG: hypothetical protein E6J78_14125 [Deltaproteobacteria bacterium]